MKIHQLTTLGFKLAGYVWLCFGLAGLVALSTAIPGAVAQTVTTNLDFLEMTIEDLLNVRVVSAGSLTKAQRRLAPATVTTITREDIKSCRARSLNQLLDTYVPNLQMIRHHWEAKHLGLRGVINDAEAKYLLLVNGKVMNERTHCGVLSERDLSMLGDIHHIDIVRGPGSAVYGPGAVSMVINIVTDGIETFKGQTFTARAGAIESFYSFEVKLARSRENGGLFVFLGADYYKGADQEEAPLVYGTDFDDFWGTPVEGGEPFEQKINNDGQTYRDKPRIKAHLQYTIGNLETWVRYTRGGELFSFAQDNLARWPYGWMDSWAEETYLSYDDFVLPGYGYQQITTQAKYQHQLNDYLDICYILNYDLFDFERSSFDSKASSHWPLSHREDEYQAKVLASWTGLENHQVAFGTEISYEQYGLSSLGFPDDQTVLSPYVPPPYDSQSPQWTTRTLSLFSEHQWSISDRLTSFTSSRLDKNTYTNWLVSPRLTLVYAPSSGNTIKSTAAKSLRMTLAEEMRWAVDHGKETSEPEEAICFEIRYERQQTPNLLLSTGVFHLDLDIISWDPGDWGENNAKTDKVGKIRQAGCEFELLYKTNRTQLALSHGFTKLIDFKQLNNANTLLTAELYGYGDDLANWSNHVTKFTMNYAMKERWEANGSARIYWGFPGARDFAEYLTDNASPISLESGYDQPFGASVYLDAGISYNFTPQMALALRGYNLMGLLDLKYNKMLYGFNSYADYRAFAPSIGLSIEVQ